MRRKYGLKPVFNDPDFDMPWPMKKFWTKAGVRREYYSYNHMAGRNWRYVIVDLRTGEDITEELR